ncbi:MAG: hypothetical protein HY897_22010 [Deltaproteobacteria bacterium]|nr:hypothetical protein [Deltaproteobacteria bacterium]
MRKTNLKEMARFGGEPAFRWVDEAGAFRRAVVSLDAGQSLGNERLDTPVSLLLVEGHASVNAEGRQVELRAGDLLDIPPFLDHSITAQSRSILWLHRYEGADAG